MQVSIEDDLRDSREVTFQAALLYTSSKGERRIRVHTLCVPTSASVPDIINSADQQAVIGMLTKFGKNDLLEKEIIGNRILNILTFFHIQYLIF